MNRLFRIIQKKVPSASPPGESGETRFPCPKCRHPNFFFNVYKRQGHCHRARCHWSPSAKALLLFWKIDVEFLGAPEPKVDVILPTLDVGLPASAHRLLQLKEGRLVAHCARCQDDAHRLYRWRGIPYEAMARYGIHATSWRICVPVFERHAPVLYVGRLKPWEAHQWPADEQPAKYEYPKGADKSKYLFRWEQLQNSTQLCLVENTFNAIWLERLNSTTSFGSQLSTSQIALIQKSKVESVVLLWDEDAKISAAKTLNKLRKVGIYTAVANIEGEPEKHSFEYLERAVADGHENARSPWSPLPRL